MGSYAQLLVWKSVYRIAIFLLPVACQFFGNEKAHAFVCASAGDVVTRIEASGVYRSDDPSHSEIDIYRWHHNKYLVAPTRHFQSVLARLADSASTGDRGGARDCMLKLLIRWAEGGGFVQYPRSQQGRFVQTWVLATIGISILKGDLIAEVRHNPDISSWLARLCAQVTDSIMARQRRNNHTYWGALAILLAAIVLQNEEALVLADNLYSEALSDIDEQGYLPEELKRGKRALHYHFFAAQPLYMYEKLRQIRFGSRQRPVELSKLLHLVTRRRTSLEFGRFTAKQMTPTEIGWIALYCHESPCEIRDYDVRQFIPRLGGRVDRLKLVLDKVGSTWPEAR